MIAKRNFESGHSLPELLIALGILAVLVTFALVNFSKPTGQLQRQNIARQMKSFFERARYDSIKRRAVAPDQMASVTINNSGSFTFLGDLDVDGVLNTGETRQVSLAKFNNVKITGNGLIFPITVRFNNRGQANAVDGNNNIIDPVFTVCDSNCTQNTANAENSSIIAVSSSGTVSFLDGGKSLPENVQPNSSNVDSAQKINQGSVVGN